VKGRQHGLKGVRRGATPGTRRSKEAQSDTEATHPAKSFSDIEPEITGRETHQVLKKKRGSYIPPDHSARIGEGTKKKKKKQGTKKRSVLELSSGKLEESTKPEKGGLKGKMQRVRPLKGTDLPSGRNPFAFLVAL